MPRLPGTFAGKGPDGADIFRPVIIVRVEIGTATAEFNAIVNSGADSTLMPAEWLVPKVNYAALPEGPPSKGAGGGFKTRPCDGKIYYGSTLICDGFMVAEPGKLGHLVLGRADFFKYFIPRFLWHKSPPMFDIDPVTNDDAPKGKAKKRKRKK